jgi:hypothetical protein
VEASERPEKGSKSEPERSMSGTLAGELPEEAGTEEALVADEELGIGYFSLAAADDSRETPRRRALGARGRSLGMS